MIAIKVGEDMITLRYFFLFLLFALCSCRETTTKQSLNHFIAIKTQKISDSFKRATITIIEVPKNNYYVDEDLIIPSNVIMNITPGTTISFKKGTGIKSSGKVVAIGSENDPIVFTATDSYWRGIRIFGENKQIEQLVQNDISWNEMLNGDKFFLEDKDLKLLLKDVNIFKHCVFEKIQTGEKYEQRINNHIAALEVNNSAVIVEHSIFRDVKFVGGVQVKRGFGYINKNKFISCGMHKNIHVFTSFVMAQNNYIEQHHPLQPCNDGIWSIDSRLVAFNNVIRGKGDDGIDLKNSETYLVDNLIENNGDDGIDMDNTKALVYWNVVKNNRENGILISNNSEAYVIENNIENNALNISDKIEAKESSVSAGLTLRNGGKIYYYNNKIHGNKTGLLLFYDYIKYFDQEVGNYKRYSSEFIDIKKTLRKIEDDFKILVSHLFELTNNKENNEFLNLWIKKIHKRDTNMLLIPSGELQKIIKNKDNNVDIDKNSLVLEIKELQNKKDKRTIKDIIDKNYDKRFITNFFMFVQETPFTIIDQEIKNWWGKKQIIIDDNSK